MANTKVIKVSPEVYDLLTKVGSRLGMTPGSLLSQILTYKCGSCGRPMFINSYAELAEAMEAIQERMKKKGRYCAHCISVAKDTLFP